MHLHTFAWHLSYVHLECGWTLKVRRQIPEHGITRHSYAWELCWGQIVNHVNSKISLSITQPYCFFRKHWEVGHMTIALKNDEVCFFRAKPTFAVWSLAAMAVGLAEKHSLVRSIRAAVGSINKRKFSPCELAVLFHLVQSPRARSEDHEGRTVARQDSIPFP